MLTACLIATAIAVPVAVGVHQHLQYEHQQANQKALAEVLIRAREARITHVEQSLQSRLAQGNLTPTQQANLQTKLATLQQKQSTLNEQFDLLATDHHPTTIYAIEYDGYADFPRYPICVLSELNALIHLHELHKP